MALLPTGRTVDAVIVDMQVQRNSHAEFFWNTFAEPPVLSAIRGGQRTTIEFRPPTSNLFVIRIDPSQRAQEDIIIYRVALRFADRSEFEIPLVAMANWNFQNITKPVLADGRLTFRSITQDPYLYGPISVPASTLLQRIGAFAQKFQRSNESIVQLVLIGAVAAALMALTVWNAVLLSLATLASCLILYVSPLAIQRLIGPDFHDVGTAIGRAALLGLSVGPSRWATLLAALAAVILAFAVWTRDRADPAKALLYGNTMASATPSGRSREMTVAFLSVLALMLLLAPDLREIVQTQLTGTYYYHWDSHNNTTWAGFIAQGKRPYIDFWYPYSGIWIFDLPIPYGVFSRYAYLVVLYCTLGVALWRLIGARALTWLVIVLLIVLLTKSGIVALPERYLLGVTLAVSYVASSPVASSGHSGRFWFWIACALVLWGEPLQFVYAAPALIVVFLHDEFWIKRFVLRDALQRAAGDFAVPFVLLICFVGFLAYRGELSGFIETNRLTAESTNYALMPAVLVFDFGALLSLASIGEIAPFVLLSIGVAGLLRPAASAERRLGLAVMCCGFLGIMLLQKHLVRPMGAQLLGPTVVGALLVFPLFSDQFRNRVLAATLCGMVAAAVLMNQVLVSLMRHAVFGAHDRLVSDYRMLVDEPAVFESARKVAFSRSRFAEYKQELAVIDKLKELGKKTWFVLTDMPVFYLFADGPPPFQINHYNTAPVRAQVNVRSWLANTKPEAVILDPEGFIFDGVQLVVREPLVASEVILNYVPFDRIGPYHLLSRRAADQPIDLAYWREILGQKVEYGRALGYTRAPTMPNCATPANAPCVRYLELTFDTETTAPEPFALPILVGSFEFQVSLVREPGVKHQYVPIDRIWFWIAGDAMSLTPTPRAPANVKVRIVDKMPRGLVLY